MLASLWQPVRSDEWMVALQNSPLRENLVDLVVEEVQFTPFLSGNISADFAVRTDCTLHTCNCSFLLHTQSYLLSIGN